MENLLLTDCSKYIRIEMSGNIQKLYPKQSGIYTLAGVDEETRKPYWIQQCGLHHIWWFHGYWRVGHKYPTNKDTSEIRSGRRHAHTSCPYGNIHWIYWNQLEEGENIFDSARGGLSIVPAGKML